MKYVTYFRSLTATEPESVSWERMMEVLRGNFLSERTVKYRSLLAQFDMAEKSGDKKTANSLKTAMKGLKQNCPAVVCQVTFDGGQGQGQHQRLHLLHDG